MRPAPGKLSRRRAAGRVLAAAAICLAGGTAAAATVEDLYRSDAIVTGTGETNRQIGFRVCLGEVLVKLSGDPTIVENSGFAGLEAEAGSFVSTFSYRDRLEGVPIHDEQGTHDRPHDLTCRYRPATLDPLLAKLGRKPWLAPRPTVTVFLAVQDQKRRFVLARDGSQSPYMADALHAAAEPLALAANLPDAAQLKAGRLDFGTLSQTDPAQLLGRTGNVSGEAVLMGTLTWSDAARGWIGEWRMNAGGAAHHWQISGVSFDDAFRNAMGGAARILSGNGQP